MRRDTGGYVYFVGAGPGDPELLTRKAARLLTEAAVVLHDSLIDPQVLALIPPAAYRLDVGKRCGGRSTAQAAINSLLVAEAQRYGGRAVVRLKGGDPGIFARLHEEIAALREAGIGYEIIPGVTAALAGAAALGCALTARGTARGVHILTGHGAGGGLPAQDWAALAKAGGTLAVYMGRPAAARLAARLLAAGVAADLPAYAIESASLPQERVIPASLATLAEALTETGTGPVLLLIGAALTPGHARAPLAEYLPAPGPHPPLGVA
jgi:uroporphyrin-III C-methyltransferase